MINLQLCKNLARKYIDEEGDECRAVKKAEAEIKCSKTKFYVTSYIKAFKRNCKGA